MPLTKVAPTGTAPVAPDTKAQELAARMQLLSERSAGRPVAGGGPKRRRHPAKKSRIAAAILSLLTTAGFTAAFAATDAPGNSVVVAAGVPVNTVANGSAASTYSGDVLSNKWGPVQVQATFAADGSLAKVDAIQVPFADGKSVRINDRAVPTLNAEALQSQSSSVDSVSGATYTSVDYERSLQSAIDAARSAGVTTLA